MNQCWPRSATPYGVTRPQWPDDVIQNGPRYLEMFLGTLGVNLSLFHLLTRVMVTVGYIRATGVVIATSRLYTFVATDVATGRATGSALSIFQDGAGVWRKINDLTHWSRDKMTAISQTTFSYVFSWMKMYEFSPRSHWSVLLKFELIIFQHWFR